MIAIISRWLSFATEEPVRLQPNRQRPFRLPLGWKYVTDPYFIKPGTGRQRRNSNRNQVG
jgi:hypothetical protein